MLRVYSRDWEGARPLPELDAEEMHHLVRVRRAREGEPVEVLNGRGDIGRAVVASADRRSCRLQLESTRTVAPPACRVHLLVALPKGRIFPTILQKAVELGASEITPLATENVEADPGRTRSKQERWDAVLIEALKQSGNPWLPALHPAESLGEAIARTEGAFRLCGALQPDARPLWPILGELPDAAESVAVFIGPEGDFSEGEYTLLRGAGCRFASLGPLVLKVETAATLTMGILRVWMDREVPC